MDLPEKQQDFKISTDDFALIDEISGLNNFLEGYLSSQDIPETVKDRLRAKMFTYQGKKPKQEALNEIRNVIFGNSR